MKLSDLKVFTHFQYNFGQLKALYVSFTHKQVKSSVGLMSVLALNL